MATKLLIKIYIALLVTMSFQAKAHINVQFAPARDGKTLQSLSLAQLVNSSQSVLQVRMTIKIKETSVREVAVIKTPGFLLQPGSNYIDRRAFANASFSFSQNYFGNAIRQTGNFPEGEYEYCFEIEVVESKDPGILPSYEQCFTYSVQPLTPLLLINPVDGDETCNKRPNFIWQPPLPLSPDARFRLVLAEIKDKQDPIEAINFNTPLINQSQIVINSLAYPVNIPELKEGGRYAWQVTVYTDKTILRKSEIWEFKIKCREEKKNVDNDSYREVKEVLDGQVYYAYGKLRFFLSNPYNTARLNYKIYSLAMKQEEIKKVPELQMTNGHNQFEIDLSEINEFKNDKDYLLKVWLADNKLLQLHFVYKEL